MSDSNQHITPIFNVPCQYKEPISITTSPNDHALKGHKSTTMVRVEMSPLPHNHLTTVIPAGNQIRLTKEFPVLGFNTYAKTLVCLDCHCGVPTKEVTGHLSSSPHKINNINPDAIIQAFKSINVKVPLDNKRTPPKHPIPGSRGSICGHAVQKDSSMSNHFSEIHKDESHLTVLGGWASNSKRTYVQHLSNSTIRYFPVQYSAPEPEAIPVTNTPPSSNHPNSTLLAWDQLASALDNLDILGHKESISITAQDNLTTPESCFMNCSGIYTHITACTNLLQCSIIELYKKVHYPKLLANWKPWVEKWLINCMTELHSVHDAVRMEALRESIDNPPSRGLIQPLNHQTTIIQYASIAAEFIIFTLQTAGQPLATHFWSDGDTELATSVKKAASLLPLIQSADLNSEQEFAINLNVLFWQSVGFSCSILKRSKVQSALEQFIALSMIKPDGSFCPPSELTQTIAALQYTIRVATIFVCLRATELFAENPPDGIDPHNPHALECASIRTFFQYFHDDKLISPFFTISNWMRLASSTEFDEDLPISTYWSNSEMTQLVIGPTTITIEAVQRALRIAISSINGVIHTSLHGALFPDFPQYTLMDMAENTSVGFNYLVASENMQIRHFKLLQDWMLNHSSFGVAPPAWALAVSFKDGQFWVNLDDVCSKKHAWDWLESADLILEHIYFIYRVGCGLPDCKTEEAATLIRNLHSAPRNIYWRENRFLFQTNRHNRPSQVYLTTDLSMHLHNYLAYIRPVQMLLLRALNQHDTANTMFSFLWVGSRQGTWDMAQFDQILQKQCFLAGLEKIGLCAWRQASVSIAHAHLAAKIPASLFSTEGGLVNPTNYSQYADANFLNASQAWQAYWGIESHLACQKPLLPVPDTLAPAKKAQQALAIFTQDPDASFRDDFQGEWLSCLFMIQIQQISLVDQTVKDFKKLKTVSFQHFEKGNCIDLLAQVIIATTNQAADPHFCNQLRSCLPTRIIIDEAHSFLEDGYRGYMPGVTALTQLSTQLILTTASLPHSQEDDLLRITFGLRRLITKRQPTFRPELNIEVLRSPAKWEQLSSVIQPLINSFLLGPKDRAMIFIENKNAVELVGPQIEAVIHHSDLPDDVAAAAVEKWISGDVKSIVATSGFGTGINYLHVRLVCIYGIPNRETANKAYQQLGRAGRDGHQAHIFFIPEVSDSHGGIDDFKKNLMNPALCPANTFAQHQDNLNWSCRNFPPFLRCVCCSRLSANPALHPSPLSLSQPSSIPDWSPDPSAPSNSYTSSCTVSAKATLGAHVGSGLAQSRKRRRLEDTDPLAHKLATSNILAAESSLSITSLARSAEQARLQSMPNNRVNSNQNNHDNSLISHELVNLQRFIRKMKGACGDCYVWNNTITPAHPRQCKPMHGKCLRCRAGKGWANHAHSGTEHTTKNCSSTSFSASISEGSKGAHGFNICTRCGLPAGSQDRFNFHPNGNVGPNCESGFANIAEAICWYVYRAQRTELGKWFPTAPLDSEPAFSKWIGITSKDVSPAPWPNGIKLLLRYEENK
ncbi:uncharacterized protein PGTG_20408 [Puccinia graminis f. sp. tritici CRL 75-36-700-3]|uniref:DNA 3'-5' helicase n=1 Tax=Puccinia graminis f. sp. tritici (strain CRL 75-36-700-3 / race SCCL) TaxID=418459 RepID=E3NY03_PUCGT|nr:uncharacterized protein PGTG_20408 [Puccinia graminis f. sp. tritici CRL 75-36-700-3]EFP94452.2 hypothetical protein PGTG_20408 [Puccinia graminis f. sp. tritici CRL 75-36-700-3]